MTVIFIKHNSSVVPKLIIFAPPCQMSLVPHLLYTDAAALLIKRDYPRTVQSN